jgi:4-hydroxy-3-methylbut-2-enyl diphosphate reductase
MKILRAQYLGMCFGVRDAIQLATQEASRRPVTVLGDLVHNPAVIDDLKQSGVQIESDLSRVNTATVIITAHGASHQRLGEVRQRGFETVEATCPLVHVAHRALSELVARGCHPVVIGKAGHVEVRGLTEDYPACDVVLSEEEIRKLKPHARFGVVAQTTQPIDRVRSLVNVLRNTFPESEILFRDTVCQPTKQRQEAADSLARESDVVLVIGGPESNNTRELAERCRRVCPKVYHISSPDDLNPNWFSQGITVGITAGTSTPDYLIDAVENRLRAWFNTNLSPTVPERLAA